MTPRILAAVLAWAVAATATGAGVRDGLGASTGSRLAADGHEPALVCPSRLDPQAAPKARTRAHLAAGSPPGLLPSGALPAPSPEEVPTPWAGLGAAQPRRLVLSDRCSRGPPELGSTCIES